MARSGADLRPGRPVWLAAAAGGQGRAPPIRDGGWGAGGGDAGSPGLAADLRRHGMLCPGAWFGVPQEEWEAMSAPQRGLTPAAAAVAGWFPVRSQRSDC